MPAFSTWLEEQHPFPDAEAGRVPLILRGISWVANLFSPRLDPRRTILVCDFEPTHEMVERRLGGLPAWIAMPAQPRDPIPDVRYSMLLTDRNPFAWTTDLDEEIAHEVDTVATCFPFDQLYGQTLRHWRRLGLKRCWFLHKGQATGVPPRLAAAYKAGQRVVRRFFQPRAESTPIPSEWHVAASVTTRPPGPLRIIHYTGWLNSGGAERQLCNLARMQKEAGHDVRVLTRAPLVGRAGHYRGLLDEAGVEARHAGAFWDESFTLSATQLDLLTALPRDLRLAVIDLALELLSKRADLLHCWLDEPNIAGFLAARLASVPAVVLSTRNVSPRQMPHMDKPWLRPWYRQAAKSPGIAFVNNSLAGARDYEDWLGLSPGIVGLARNAFLPPLRPSAEEVARVRREFGIRDGDPVVAAVFRLDREKRPFLFVEIIDRVRRAHPNLRVLWAGCGGLESALHADIKKRGLERTILMLGQRGDVPTILAASDLTLLVSEAEGTPNVVLEAQYLGCVPIATDAGGTAEAMEPARTGLLLTKDDTEGLVRATASLLNDTARRQNMAAAGRAWVLERFDPKRVFEETMDLYADLLTERASRAA